MESLHSVPVAMPPKEYWQRKKGLEDSYRNNPGSHREGIEKFSPQFTEAKIKSGLITV